MEIHAKTIDQDILLHFRFTMAENPDESSYIHDQPTDTLNESSSSSEDEAPGGEVSLSESLFAGAVNEIGAKLGPLKPPRRSYCPSVSTRGSFPPSISDESEDDDQSSRSNENSNYVRPEAFER